MDIQQLDKLGPSEFLEKIKETPYSTEEQTFDIVPVVATVLADSIGYILYPLRTLKGSYWYLINHIPTEENEKFLVLTSEKVKKTLTNKDKFTHIVETTERLAKKMGLGTVVVALSDNKKRSNSSLKTDNIRLIILNLSTLDLSNEAIEFIIAHELAHLQHHDGLKRLAFAWLVLGCNLVAFRYFTIGRAIGVGILTRIIAGRLERAIQVRQERAADAKALQCLNSNRGMIDCCYPMLKSDYRFKHTPAEEIQKRNPTLKIEEIEGNQRDITPHGDNRLNTTHPPLTERLAHALSFKPV